MQTQLLNFDLGCGYYLGGGGFLLHGNDLWLARHLKVVKGDGWYHDSEDVPGVGEFSGGGFSHGEQSRIGIGSASGSGYDYGGGAGVDYYRCSAGDEDGGGGCEY